MIYIKTIFLTLMPYIVTLFGAYLVGSFISAAWTPDLWTADARILMSIIGMVFGHMLYMRLRADNVL